MPSSITHTYISLDILDKLNEKPKELIKPYLEDYKTFAQGTDIFYFYHIFTLKENIVIDIGHRFHNYKTNEIFKYIINYCKENNKDIIFTYLSALVTHYMGDSTIHPYINFKAQNTNNVKRKDKHFEIETFLDNYMLSKKYNNYNTYKNYKLLFNNKKNEDIVNLLNNLFEKFFNYKNMGNIYYRAIKEMRFTFKYIRYDKYKIKQKIYSLIDKNPFNIRRTKYLSYNFKLNNKEYYLNNNHKEWYNPSNKDIKSNKSFDDLYQETIIKGVNIINKLYDYIYLNKDIDIDKLLGNLSYSNGLPLN